MNWIRIVVLNGVNQIVSIVEIQKKIKKDETLGNGFLRLMSKAHQEAKMMNGHVEIWEKEYDNQ